MPVEAELPTSPVELNGTWHAIEADEELRRSFADRDLDERGWETLEVPGHWRSAPAFSDSDGPILYRRHFETDPREADPREGRRSWLVLDGLFYQGDVWLDGAYLGDTEGYFVRHSFEVTDTLRARTEHVVALEVTCAPQINRASKRNITGAFQHAEYLDPDWNPGGIWRPVRIEHTGPVRLRGLRALCPQADAHRATVALRAELDTLEARHVTLRTTLAGCEDVAERPLAAGSNFVTWTITVPEPELWWPHALGDQACHDLVVEVIVDGVPSHQLTRRIGLRSLIWKQWTLRVNGERLFLKGTNLGPTRIALGEATVEEIGRDVDLAKDAGLDLLRVHGHIARPELYEAADRAGMLVWQDLPLHGGYARGIRHQAARQAVAAVDQFGHHPSIALWCGHDEPFALEGEPGTSTSEGSGAGTRRLRRFADRQLPTWNRSILDRTIRRALEKADPTRPVIAHSGVLPHPGSTGTDTHSSLGWAHGNERDLPTLVRAVPRLARFVSEFGAQAVPFTDAFLEPDSWPNLDWERLEHTHGMQRRLFERHVPPHGFADFAEWQAATQDHQVQVVKHHVETLRRLKYRPTGGFCQYFLADAQPAISSSVLDHDRVPKAGYHALSQACRPVIVVADRLDALSAPRQPIRLDVHVVSDLRHPIEAARVSARMTWAEGIQEWSWEGRIPADACVRVGRIDTRAPEQPGLLTLELTLDTDSHLASNFDRCMVDSPGRFS